MRMFQNRQSTGFGLVLLVILTMLATTAPAAPLPDFVLGGGAGACVAPATPITGGCQLLIAGPYTDAAGNDFTILDASSTNKARIEFVEASGGVDKLIVTGAVIKALEQITNATITFKHLFTSTQFNQANLGRNTLSGGYALLFANATARTTQATASAELCQAGVGCLTTDGNLFTSPALVGSIAAAKTVGSFAPTPDEEPYAAPGFQFNSLLRGQITISSLRNTERVTNLSHTLLLGSSLPPFDGPGTCDGDEDIGRIVRGTAPERDTICVKSEDGVFLLMAGAEALSVTGASCPIAFEEQVDGLKFENQILKFFESSTSGF